MNDLIYIFLPLIMGYTTTFFCNPGSKRSSNSNSFIKYKPPREVFLIVWPILYILIGLAWNNSKGISINNYLFILLNILLCSWIIVYSCLNNKKSAFIILLLSILVSIICFLYSNVVSKYLLSPLIIWLCFASLISD